MELKFAIYFLSLLITAAFSVQGDNADPWLPYGNQYGDKMLGKGEGISSPAVLLSSPMYFFAKRHSRLFVNSNGVISFKDAHTRFDTNPFSAEETREIVAPFFGHVDTSTAGTIYYRQSTDPNLLSKEENFIQSYFSLPYFKATLVFIATWDKVGFYGNGDKSNTFQCILVTNDTHSFAVFNYGDINWTTGDNSGGIGGLWGIEAQAGFVSNPGSNESCSADEDHVGCLSGYYSLPGSGSQDIINIGQTTNMDLRGTWMFKISDSLIIFPIQSAADGTDPPPVRMPVKPVIRFAHFLSSNMVLQHSKVHRIWGYGSNVQNVVVKVTQDYDQTDRSVNKKVQTETANCNTIKKEDFGLYNIPPKAVYDGVCKWEVQINGKTANRNSYTITASSRANTNIFEKLTNVKFGDVWVCSGQSNMQFTGSMNIQRPVVTSEHSDVRLLVVSLAISTTDAEMEDIKGLTLNWAEASDATVNGPGWTYFSAVCWFFGEKLYQELKYPIGLVSTTFPNTYVEEFTAIDVFSCEARLTNSPGAVGVAARLWGAMIHPLTKMNIFGAVWYQGETDSTPNAVPDYENRLINMITDWRKKWHKNTNGQTLDDFTFGVVQISSVDQVLATILQWNFAEIRAKQEIAVKKLNEQSTNSFIICSMDLSEPNSPYASMHPRRKRKVGERLANGALSVAYKKDKKNFPYESSNLVSATYKCKGKGDCTIKLVIDDVKLQYVHKSSFKAQCGDGGDWKIIDAAATLTEGGSQTTVNMANPCPQAPTSIRYCWSPLPCDLNDCSIYNKNRLPMMQFMKKITAG